ncbi:MAG: 50S ribosomal protein L29 [Actinobacteria bacterium]|nr:50S ribosomal protein L29 [Actinomycetota bacterium]
MPFRGTRAGPGGSVRAAEIRDLPVDEIERRLLEVKEELFNMRFQNATGQLDNYKRMGQLKKDIARIQTILREHDLNEGSE